MNTVLDEPARLELLAAEPKPAQPLAVPPQAQAQAGRQLSVVEYAMQNGASAADVRALVELQIQMDQHKLAMMKAQDERERVQRLEARELAFREDFAKLRGENIIVPKSLHVDRGLAGSFNQAEYHVASTMLSPALSRHGFSFRHDMKFGAKSWTTDGVASDVPWVYVTCYLEHRGGHTEKLDLEGPPGELKANTPVQNMQVTGSFLKRQSLLAITGTATGGEDDENRMRKRGGGAEPVDDEAALQQVDAGEAKAKDGLAVLTAWWGTLTAKDRNVLSQSFKGWRATAIKADQQRGAA